MVRGPAGRGGLPAPGNWTMRPGPKERTPSRLGMNPGLGGQVKRIPFAGGLGHDGDRQERILCI